MSATTTTTTTTTTTNHDDPLVMWVSNVLFRLFGSLTSLTLHQGLLVLIHWYKSLVRREQRLPRILVTTAFAIKNRNDERFTFLDNNNNNNNLYPLPDNHEAAVFGVSVEILREEDHEPTRDSNSASLCQGLLWSDDDARILLPLVELSRLDDDDDDEAATNVALAMQTIRDARPEIQEVFHRILTTATLMDSLPATLPSPHNLPHDRRRRHFEDDNDDDESLVLVHQEVVHQFLSQESGHSAVTTTFEEDSVSTDWVVPNEEYPQHFSTGSSFANDMINSMIEDDVIDFEVYCYHE